MSIQTIKKEVSRLNRAQQAELMHFMIELLMNDKFELSEEWKEELDKRETALENGTSVGKPFRKVLSKYH